MFEKTKKFCDSFLAMGLPGFDLAVYKDGECILRHMGGYSDLENEIPMQGNERYNIYSCSKPITCVAAMQLWEKGLFSLEDKLSDYMPEFKEMTVRTSDGIKKAENPILIKHLFEMTAGFSYDLFTPQLLKCRAETDGRCPTRETMKYLAKDPLLFTPGDRWEYSLCHDVLAAFVEVVSGERFEEYVRKHIFDVLGMKESTFILPEAERDTVSPQYEIKDNKLTNVGKNIPYKIGSEYASGGAGCVSTVDDYIKFLEALRVGDLILKKETIAFMMTDRLNEKQRDTYTTNATHGYGLGLRVPKQGGLHTEFGWGGAAGAYLAVDIENGLSIFLAQHMFGSPNQEIRSMVYLYILAELTGKKEYITFIENARSTEGYKYTY